MSTKTDGPTKIQNGIDLYIIICVDGWRDVGRAPYRFQRSVLPAFFRLNFYFFADVT